jgi:hypothetical protein
MEETRSDDFDDDGVEIHEESGLTLNSLQEVLRKLTKLLIILKIIILFMTEQQSLSKK